jgi:hypothetical protein
MIAHTTLGKEMPMITQRGTQHQVILIPNTTEVFKALKAMLDTECIPYTQGAGDDGLCFIVEHQYRKQLANAYVEWRTSWAHLSLAFPSFDEQILHG